MTERTASSVGSQLVLMGAGGHAAVVCESALRAGFVPVAFAAKDDPPEQAAGPFATLEALGDPSGEACAARVAALLARGAMLHSAVGDGTLRARLAAHAPADASLATVVDPSATVSPSAVLGAGVFVAAGAIVQARARLGRLAIVNTRAVVEHDCVIGEAAHVSPAAVLCGGVELGARAQVGAGAVVIPGVRIGADAMVGAGAVVTRDVAPGATVMGVPAKPSASS